MSTPSVVLPGYPPPPPGGSGTPPRGTRIQTPLGGYPDPDPPGGVPRPGPPRGGPGPPQGVPGPPQGGTRTRTPPGGVPGPPLPPRGQTDGWMEGQTLVKTLPSLVLRTRAVNIYVFCSSFVMRFVTSAIQTSHMTHQVFINMALTNLACCYDVPNRNITKDIYDS